MRGLRSEAELEILTCGRYIDAARAKFCRESKILSHQWRTSITGGIYRFITRTACKLPRTKFYRGNCLELFGAASRNLRLPLAINFTWHEQAVLECGGNSNAVASKI